MKRLVGVALIFLMLSGEMAIAGTITGTVSTKKLKVPKDILVYIEKVEAQTFSPPEAPVKMDQISCVFTPRVLPILLGTKVEFHNSDDLKHNVFAVGDYDFDLGVWGKDGVGYYTFDRLGEAVILCNVHPEMEAYIVVLQNTYFGLTDEQGRYRITGVPPGEYRLKTWNDKLRPQSKEVAVSSAGDTVTVDFALK